jgi:hypothetical protein
MLDDEISLTSYTESLFNLAHLAPLPSDFLAMPSAQLPLSCANSSGVENII